eukprot:16434030-Heterocapsa_arctica.AAC.1
MSQPRPLSELESPVPELSLMAGTMGFVGRREAPGDRPNCPRSPAWAAANAAGPAAPPQARPRC